MLITQFFNLLCLSFHSVVDCLWIIWFLSLISFSRLSLVDNYDTLSKSIPPKMHNNLNLRVTQLIMFYEWSNKYIRSKIWWNVKCLVPFELSMMYFSYSSVFTKVHTYFKLLRKFFSCPDRNQVEWNRNLRWKYESRKKKFWQELLVRKIASSTVISFTVILWNGIALYSFCRIYIHITKWLWIISTIKLSIASYVLFKNL